MLAWFAAHKNHIGFYLTAEEIEAFKAELMFYKWAKGSVQFPLDKPLPLNLTEKIIRFKVKQNTKKTKGRSIEPVGSFLPEKRVGQRNVETYPVKH